MSSAERLSVGDFAPNFPLPPPLGASDIAGRPLVVFFFDARSEQAGPLLADFAQRLSQFGDLGANLVGVRCQSNGAFGDTLAEGTPYPIAQDNLQVVGRAFGVYGEDQTLRNTAVGFVIGPNLKVVRIFDEDEASLATLPERMLDEVRQLVTREQPRQIVAQAPVLLIADVFDREFCRELIGIWETQGNSDSGFMRQEGERTVGVLDYGHKRRRDHFLSEGPTKERIKRLVGHRVVPEIRRAFNFEVTRFEDFRIVCYDSAVGGYFRPHRDNTTTGTAHRRFAMTVNLNTEEHEGGALRFPEFGPHLYRPATGQAVIFSCSLLHEATDVTAGRRFALLSFFYGEREARMREQYAPRTSEAGV